MQEENPTGSVREDLLARLRNLGESQADGTLAELAYRRAREALERALEEARTIRLEAIEDARVTREREQTSLVESLKALRQSAETQIDGLLRAAEIEADRLRSDARLEAASIREEANKDAALIHADAAVVRRVAEERSSEVARLEADFNALLDQIGGRLGMPERPSEGWWARLTRGRGK